MNIQTAKLSLVNGRPYSSPSEMNQASVRDGMLYIIVEVSAPIAEWDQVTRELVARIIETVRMSQMDDTDALHEAATDINHYLMACNEMLPKKRRIWAGVNMLFIRDNQLFLAQAGPALTYIVRDNLVTSYPQYSHRQMPIPLGGDADINYGWAHFTLQPNDILSLTGSHLPTLAEEAIIHEAMRGENPDEVVSALVEVAGREDFSAFVLQYEPSPRLVPTEPLSLAEASQDKWAEELAQANTQANAQATAPSATEDIPALDTWHEEANQEPSARRGEEATYKNLAEPAFAGQPDPAVAVTAPAGAAYRSMPPPSPSADSAFRASPPHYREPMNRPPHSDREVFEEPERSGSPTTPMPADDGSAIDSSNSMNWQAWLRQLGIWLLAALSGLLAGLSGVIGWVNKRVVPRVTNTAPAFDKLAHTLWNGTTGFLHTTGQMLRQLLPGYQARQPRSTPPVSAPAGDGSDFLRMLTITAPILLLLMGLLLWSFQGEATVESGSENNNIVEAASQAESDSESDSEPQNVSDTQSQSTPEDDQNFLTLLGESERTIREAESVEKPLARRLLGQATEKLKQAETLAKDDTKREQLVQVQQQAVGLLDQLDNVQRPPLITMATLNSESLPTSMVYGSNDLFVLVGNAAYHLGANHPLGSPLEANTPFLAAQQSLQGGAIVVGTPKTLTWVPVADTRPHNALLILTTEGQLIEYEPISREVKLLESTNLITDINASEGYYGNLYLLDRNQRQILKYVPNQYGQYTSEPVGWITMMAQENIGQAIDLAIDGYIFLLEENGQVKRLQKGEWSNDFWLPTVEPPLTQPVAIAKVAPESTDLFVADRERIIRVSSKGELIVQYRPPFGEANDWGEIRDIAINPENTQLYILSNKGVYFIDISPPEAAPPATENQGTQENQQTQEGTQPTEGTTNN